MRMSPAPRFAAALVLALAVLPARAAGSAAAMSNAARPRAQVEVATAPTTVITITIVPAVTPRVVTVTVGMGVAWFNDDNVRHTIEAHDGSFGPIYMRLGHNSIWALKSGIKGCLSRPCKTRRGAQRGL